MVSLSVKGTRAAPPLGTAQTGGGAGVSRRSASARRGWQGLTMVQADEFGGHTDGAAQEELDVHGLQARGAVMRELERKQESLQARASSVA